MAPPWPAAAVAAAAWRLATTAPFLLLLSALAAQPALAQPEQQAVQVFDAEQLREALLGGAARVSVMAPVALTLENWPDTVVISRSVILSSPYRTMLDLCDADCRSGAAPVRPLVNVTSGGSLLLQRVFLRHFLPAQPQDLAAFGPVPGLLSSGGGLISFNLVVFHFQADSAWVFSRPPAQSWWASEQATAMAEVGTGRAAVSLDKPGLYALDYAGRDYAIGGCFAVLDLDDCLSEDVDHTTLVYCP